MAALAGAVCGGDAAHPCELDMTCVLVTSPTMANPGLGLLPAVLDSFRLVRGLDTCRGGVIIVMDGYVVANKEQPKRGRVTQAMADNYELYHDALLRVYTLPRYRIVRCPEHVGFAHAVRTGLLQVSTTFALVAQHDRAFVDTFDELSLVLDAMARHEWIRYVGFPSVMNRQHANLLHCQYGLKMLAAPQSRIALGGAKDVPMSASAGSSGGRRKGAEDVEAGLVLMPLIFWYDSQHICHVQRYLKIFEPPADMPRHLKDKVCE